MKSYFYQIYKIISLLLLTNISNLYAHNLINGGCKEHCGQKVKVINNKNKLKNVDDHINIESKNSCLNKSLSIKYLGCKMKFKIKNKFLLNFKN